MSSVFLYELDSVINGLQTPDDFIDLILVLVMGAALSLIAYILYRTVKYTIQFNRYMYKFPKYKMIFSNYHFDTIDDIMEISKGQLGDKKHIEQCLHHYINNSHITGIRLDSDEIKYVDAPKREELSPSSQKNSRTTSSISDEIARLSSYCNHKIITEEEFQTAKAKLFDAERVGEIPSLSDEIANLTSYRNNGTITNEEFQKAKAKLFES